MRRNADAMPRSRVSGGAARLPPAVGLAASVLVGALALSGCSSCREPEPAPEGDGPVVLDDSDSSRPAQPSRPDDPVLLFVDKGASYLAGTQSPDGSWIYLQSRTPDFSEPVPQANVIGTLMTLVNLTDTDYEASSTFERGTDYLRGLMNERFTWSRYAPRDSDDSWVEPDADTTALALTTLSGRFPLAPEALQKVRALFEQHRADNGLYRTYFDGFYGEKGFVPGSNETSIGVNLNVLGWLGKQGLERADLLAALRKATSQERYWEADPQYPSLPMLAYLASRAVENGAPEAGELLRKFLTDLKNEHGGDVAFAELDSLELACYIQARSHECLVNQSPCRDFDMAVFELAKVRNADGSWPISVFRYEPNRDGIAVYGGSPALTTSFALKALATYRVLLEKRPSFSMP